MVATVITARTTAYSAIVCPSSFRTSDASRARRSLKKPMLDTSRLVQREWTRKVGIGISRAPARSPDRVKRGPRGLRARQKRLFELVVDLGVAMGDTALHPALGHLEQPAAELRELVLVAGQELRTDLDADLVDGSFRVRADLEAPLGDDRDVGELGEQVTPQLLDLRRRRLPAGEEAEVDLQLEGRNPVLRWGKDRGGILAHARKPSADGLCRGRLPPVEREPRHRLAPRPVGAYDRFRHLDDPVDRTTVPASPRLPRSPCTRLLCNLRADSSARGSSAGLGHDPDV